MLRADAARVVENVAASIADGAHVDWEQADANVSGRELRLVQHLRVIDSLAGVYRTLPSLVEDEAGPGTRPDYPEGPRWGRLILLDRIGSGSSADVYRAWDAELQREVALKLLRDEGVSGSAPANARLLQEARRLARIRHPHVVHVYGAERHEERIGLWMELVRGRSIDEVVRQDGPIDVAEAAHVGIDLCSALAAVHGAGLLHRDVKAQNVIREDSGRLVLMDFGTGEEIEDQTPRLAGTPIYLSPEVISRGPASVQSDLYAVGVLLFYAVTGEFPVVGDSLDGLAQAHREGRCRAVRDVQPAIPAAMARVVDRALAPDPRRRYASASAMEAALRQAVNELPGQRARGIAQWGLVATMMAAIVVLVAMLIGTLRTGPPSSRISTLAVLPLRFVSGEADAPYLAEGLTDQLITTLGQIHSLKVTAQTSVARFKGTDVPVAEIARQLGVDGIVEGTVLVQKGTGNQPARARVNVRLIKAGSDLDIWSGSLERPLGDMLALESELAQDDRSSDAWRADAGRECEPARLTEDRSAAEQAVLRGTNASRSVHDARATRAGGVSAGARHRSPLRSGARRRCPELRCVGLCSRHLSARGASLGRRGGNTCARDRRRAGRSARSAGRHQVFLRLGLGRGGARVPARDRARPQRLLRTRAVCPVPGGDGAPARGPDAGRGRRAFESAGGRGCRGARADPGTTADSTDEALKAADHAALLDPESPGILFLRGRILEAQGKLDEAAVVTDDAIKESDTVALGWKVQAIRLQALMGHRAEAVAAFDRLRAEPLAENLPSSPHEAYLRLALGEPDKALAILGHAVRRGIPACCIWRWTRGSIPSGKSRRFRRCSRR